MTLLVILVTSLSLTAGSPTTPPPLPDLGKEVAVVIEAPDGLTLRGVLHRPLDAAGEDRLPLVLVIHPLGLSRESTHGLISDLLARDLAVMSLDLRGHGQSRITRNATIVSFPYLRPQDFQDMIRDQRLLVDWAQERPGLDPGRIGLVGVGFGSLIAAEVAGDNPRIKALALVGPTVPAFGIDGESGLEALGDRPAWIGTSRTNKVWLERAERLASRGRGERTLQTYEASVAKTDHLLDLPELTAALIAWLKEHLDGTPP
jgi:alpha-beta hydrolase superfamily lysophospholipase